MKQKTVTAILIFLAIVVIDQLIKIYIKTHFILRESYEVTSWFYLSFIENNGMAYGMEIGSKLALTFFRIVAVAGFGVFLLQRIRKNEAPWFFVVNMAMIVAGAVGNIIDCVFYGRWFTNSYGQVAQWTHSASGLEPAGEWFQGRVVDMFYFPLIRFNWPESFPRTEELVNWFGVSFRWPEWLPCSNEPFLFFKPVFNFADAAISVGVALLLLNYIINSYKEVKNKEQHA